MVSLKTVNEKFLIPFQVVANGSGTVRATLSEAEQAAQPAFIFTQPRHVLRTDYPTGLTPGMTIQSPSGELFMVGENGPAENRYGTLWQSFRLYEPTGSYTHTRRTTSIDPITKTEVEGKAQSLDDIHAALEPFERENTDREMRRSFETRRFITGSEVTTDDFIDNRQVVKVDKQLGLYIGILQ